MKIMESLENLGALGKRLVLQRNKKNCFKIKMEKQGVVAIVIYEGKILLGKKKSNSPKLLAGKWHIPGETIEGNEDDKSALIRGMKEEAGIEIFVKKYVGNSISPNGHKLRWYECSAETDKVIYGSDLEDVKWVLKDEVLNACDKDIVRFWSKEIIDYLSH